ncbi:MAG: guanylate kinase [Fimbriimonadaceae bacterium]
MNGKLVIFSGPSGVGKDTLLDAWHEANPKVTRVVAYTSRAPREGEVDGVSYHFVSREEFTRKVEHGDFLEYKEVHGNLYATPLADMERMLEAGLIAVLKIDVQGALTVMELRPDAITIFVQPPSWEELERRIRVRGLDDPATIEKRLMNARDEVAHAGAYQHQITNDSIERAVRELEGTVL